MLVLASASPRRQEILRNAAIEFIAHATGVPEQPAPDEDPTAYTLRLAREKAWAAAQEYPEAFILGADTTVVMQQHMLEKPRDAADAVRMLQLLSGNSHQVITGVCLLSPLTSNGREQNASAETTSVQMVAITASEIRDYVTSGEPMDKAGAYAIQGRASRWISRIEGDYSNVVGLPIALVYRMLRQYGAL
jgi:septum formation protein